MNLSPASATVSISFIGEDVHTTLGAHREVMRAVNGMCSDLIDATVKVHIAPRVFDQEPLEWTMDVCSPGGRKTVTVTQRVPLGSISFSDK